MSKYAIFEMKDGGGGHFLEKDKPLS